MSDETAAACKHMASAFDGDHWRCDECGRHTCGTDTCDVPDIPRDDTERANRDALNAALAEDPLAGWAAPADYENAAPAATPDPTPPGPAALHHHEPWQIRSDGAGPYCAACGHPVPVDAAPHVAATPDPTGDQR